jgi:hypothetical protein
MMSEAALQARYAAEIGQKFGLLKLTAIADERAGQSRVLGIFRCGCGVVRTYPLGRMLGGKYRTHCGCLTDIHKPRTHGMRYTREYGSWQAMKARCLDSNNKDYPRWGGRGITVCSEWADSFEAFFAHVGQRPKGTTLDRIDTTRGYEPGNVRWATPSEQARNRLGAFRWHIKGRDFETHGEAAEHFGVSEHTIWRWVNGQFDKRRNRMTPPRSDCHVTPRY